MIKNTMVQKQKQKNPIPKKQYNGYQAPEMCLKPENYIESLLV